VKEAMDHAKTGFMENFAERFGVMVAKAKKCEPVPKAAETPEDAAEKQQDNADEEKNPANAVKNSADAAEKQQDDVTDITDGNMETESEPEKEDKTPDG
jgi:hypothetical protein